MTTKDDFINKVVQEEFGFIDYQTAFVHLEPEEFTRIMYRVMEEYALACLEKASKYAHPEQVDLNHKKPTGSYMLQDDRFAIQVNKESIISKDNLV
jgi:hypothetical protein